MTLLSDADLDGMRGVLNESLPDTAVIYASSYVSDGGGGGTTSWVAGGTVSCRVGPVSGDEAVFGDRISADAEWIVTLPAETSITTNSQIAVGSKVYRVEALRAPRSYEICRRVEVKEIV